ncbi:response regulator [Microvirga lotononidis]|uniref:histidine kinase n=1 Tax=Microvirga lotononidis TaxID=864069 RepID=I4YSF2_9HYPH|nr:response regulator [Microvirga lotononidis]EIM26894.1 PAS domain S-box [Microvirga lotononidis]WQO31445.1 response regulator [Microvirga lotononidis]
MLEDERQVVSNPGVLRPGSVRPLSDVVLARILVVDDDPRNLLAVEEVLRSPGIEIVTADSGEAALRRVLQDDFALILLDVQMPRLDGYEVAGLIRTRPRSARVPILFLTAVNKDDVHVFKGYSAGAVDYVFKPVEPLILKAKVAIFVDLYRKTEEIRRQGEEERRLLMENLRVRSEKLKAEQALRRREEHQSLVLQSLPIALYTASVTGDHRQLHFTNESIERITGFGPEAFLERPDFWSTRLHPEDRDRVLAQLHDLAEDGTVSLEYRWRCADGTDRHVLDQTVLMRDDEGRPREFFGMWFDITERKQMEQNLLHASKLEAVGRLTGGIAHDFNNMLSVVIGNLDLLRKSIQGDETAERRVRMAMESAQHCADLTYRLLAFSRRQPLQVSTIDVKTLMPGLLDLMRRTLGERIHAKLHLDQDVWSIQADRAQLEAALLNLAVNARDAMPEGGDLTIAVENRVMGEGRAVPAGAYVMIAVGDTGAGMPPEVLKRVFEPFFTTKESGKGTGLGLSMVYGFVQQSHGDVEIDSIPNEGTSIRMFLPRAEGVAEQLQEAQPAVAEPFGAGQTVLVVEDDPAVRQVALSTIRSLGFEAIEAGSADEALRLLKENRHVRLVFSDVRMPGELNGIDLARVIKREMPDIRVLLTTGYVDDDETIDDVDLLYKPYRTSDLAAKIQSVMAVPQPRDVKSLPASAPASAAE